MTETLKDKTNALQYRCMIVPAHNNDNYITVPVYIVVLRLGGVLESADRH